jgi:polyhydroxyalkanoate synthesis repressor PhaR
MNTGGFQPGIFSHKSSIAALQHPVKGYIPGLPPCQGEEFVILKRETKNSRNGIAARATIPLPMAKVGSFMTGIPRRDKTDGWPLAHCARTVMRKRLYKPTLQVAIWQLLVVAVQQGVPPMEPATVVIKKYGNRRLYDTAGSRYVNLEDIAALIRQGKQVQVVDAKTGENLTRVTLTQIITEDARDKPTGLPLELLRQLIVASDQTRQEFIMWYLKSAFDTYQTVQDAVQNRLSDMQSAILSPVESMKRFLGAARSSPPPQPEESELKALRKRVAELEGRVKKKSKAKKNPSTGKASRRK